VLSAEGQEFGGRKRGEKGIAFRALWGRERKRGKRSRKYLKKYFGEAEKIPTFAAPQVGKEKGKKDRRRKADGE